MVTTALGNTMMGVLGLNGEATLLVLVLTLFLFGAHRFPLFISGLTQGLKRFHGAIREIIIPFRSSVRRSGHGIGQSRGRSPRKAGSGCAHAFKPDLGISRSTCAAAAPNRKANERLL